MATRVAINIPLHSKWVLPCMERIIDLKVKGFALTTLEKLFDWLAMALYCPYRNLSDAKMSRIHTFRDGIVKLYDCTERGIAKIQGRNAIDLITGRRVVKDDIAINDKRVLFHRNLRMELIFSRAAFTDYVVVNNLPDQRIEIVEQETPRVPGGVGAINRWSFNLNQNDHLMMMAGMLPIGNPIPVYIVDEAPVDEADAAV